LADYLKIPEVARRLDVSEPTVRRMVKGGKLPSVFIGGAYRISEEDLAEYIENARVTPGKAQRRSSVEPSFNDVLDDERRAAWGAAVAEGQRLRETGRNQVWKALSEWSASKKRGEPYSTRRKYLDEMGDLLREVYDADGVLGWAYIEAALSQGGSEASVPRYLREESRKMGHFYGELLGLVKSAGLSVLTGDDAAAAKQATAEDAAAEHVESETRPLRVEEPEAA
jgi:excisionase family DNA binding protein